MLTVDEIEKFQICGYTYCGLCDDGTSIFEKRIDSLDVFYSIECYNDDTAKRFIFNANDEYVVDKEYKCIQEIFNE